jgi:peptidylprolyl isomerase
MRRVVWLGLAGLAMVAGCARDGDEQVPLAGADPPAGTPDRPEPAPAPRTDLLDQPFDLAASPIAPVDSVPPPDRTLAGKPTAPLLAAVKEAWNRVRFPMTDGKPDPVRLRLTTDAGEVEFTLFPDAAPNHVRNLLALAAVGYYDGLVFERVVKREAVTTAGTIRFELVTAGCPCGLGNPGQGHLGYFLKPEFNTLTHEEGTVGFWREDDDVSAGTRIYVTLAPCPAMDGKYTVVGKVSRGLEVVHRIAGGRLREPDLERPATPVVIRRAAAD